MKLSTLILITILSLMPLSLVAQELSPRAYWPAPKGTQVATIGYSFVSGDIVPDPSLPITGVNSRISTLSFSYLRTVNLWGRTANLLFNVPTSSGYTAGTGPIGGELRRDYQGVGDISATLFVNFLGGPSMTREEFVSMRGKPRTILGGSLKLVAPTGNYDSDRLINVGANRWAVKAELGVIAPISEKWLFEAALGRWFFEDNDDFVSFKKTQKPITAVQAHLIHRFRPGLWASLDANFYSGGRSTVDGRRLDDSQRDSKVGLTVVFPVARKHVFKVGYSIGSLNDTDEDFDIILFAYSQIF